MISVIKQLPLQVVYQTYFSMTNITSEFSSKFKQAISDNTFVKLSIHHPRNKQNDLKKLIFQLVKVQGEAKIKCVYTHQTKDITKNYSFEEASELIMRYLGVDFKNGIIFTIKHDINLMFNKKMEGKIIQQKATFNNLKSTEHNKQKKRWIQTKNNPYLLSLGVVDEKGNVNKNKTDKFKQINKYIETVEGILNTSELKDKKDLSIVDMGSGKGYLTFALYDYLTNTMHKNVSMIGVEQRPDLIQICNNISKENHFSGLHFNEGSIDSFKTDKIDILIALHACDTATDDAIYSGISSKASIIITAPCCHKQVRKQLNIDNELKEITQFGILEERQAEILTDTIRALVLESEGYKSQVFEFIADAHTHKNVMVVGTKKQKTSNTQKYLEKIDSLKTKFGIEYQHLEKKIRKKD